MASESSTCTTAVPSKIRQQTMKLEFGKTRQARDGTRGDRAMHATSASQRPPRTSRQGKRRQGKTEMRKGRTTLPHRTRHSVEFFVLHSRSYQDEARQDNHSLSHATFCRVPSAVLTVIPQHGLTPETWQDGRSSPPPLVPVQPLPALQALLGEIPPCCGYKDSVLTHGFYPSRCKRVTR